MHPWRPTESLLRAVTVAVVGLGLAVVTGSPVAAVLAAPFALHAALGLRRPGAAPLVDTRLDDVELREGQGTRSVLRLVGEQAAVEHVTRIAAPTSYVAHHPAGGRTGARWREGGSQVVELSARRWGRRRLGQERVWLTSTWSGYRSGPVEALGRELGVLPEGLRFDARSGVPRPPGLVGPNPSAREAAGAEVAGIRPFQPGDRLRRINWRVSSRTERLHVTTSQAEADASVHLVVDALADLGSSGGVDGAASSLDLTVRAAAALAEHHLLRGDRVALRVIGLEGASVPPGVGRRHLRRILGTLAATRSGMPHGGVLDQLRLRPGAGATVMVLSPVMAEQVATATADVVRRGHPTLVVDTLPPALGAAELDHAAAQEGTATDEARCTTVRQAWRMRTLEREAVLASLAAVGCPVVPWRGPGTLDEVLRGLARRATLPRSR